MLSQETETISFELEANETIIAFLKLKNPEKMKVIQLGMNFLNVGNSKIQRWNNDEWEAKLQKEKESYEMIVNDYIQQLECCKESIEKINQKHKSELLELKKDITQQIKSKNEYTISELRNDVSRLNEELISLQEQRNNSFKLAFNDYDERLTKKEEQWELKLNNLRKEYDEKLENEKKEKQDLLMRKQNSTIIGQDGETSTLHQLTRMFPTAEIEDTHKERGRGDFIFKENNCIMLVETKNYKGNVTKPEIEKFYRDMDTNHDINCGVMISLTSGISAREDFQLEVREKKPIIFLHNVLNNSNNLKLAVKLFNIILKTNTIDLTDREITDKINILIPIVKRNMNAMKQKIQKFNTEIMECTTYQERLICDLISTLRLT